MIRPGGGASPAGGARPASLLLALVVLSVVVAGCGGGPTGAGSGSTTAGAASPSTAADLQGAITVSAAASLREAFTRLGDEFTADNPGVEITFGFDSSSRLSTQIIEGAPVDVYASADEANMTRLTGEGLVAGRPSIFARNELVIVTRPGNPEGITGLADLAGVGVVALCGEDVPCGRYAAKALDAADVRIPEGTVTRGQNAAATLTAVADGDAVAGIVYRTDALSAGSRVDTVAIPTDQMVVATYPIGVLATSGETEIAEAFVAFVLSDDGQAVLQDHGFLPAP